MVRQEGEKFLVLFNGRGCRVSPRFRFFVFDVNQGMKRQDGFKIFCIAQGMERLSLHLLQAVRNIVCALEVGCGDV